MITQKNSESNSMNLETNEISKQLNELLSEAYGSNDYNLGRSEYAYQPANDMANDKSSQQVFNNKHFAQKGYANHRNQIGLNIADEGQLQKTMNGNIISNFMDFLNSMQGSPNAYTNEYSKQEIETPEIENQNVYSNYYFLDNKNNDNLNFGNNAYYPAQTETKQNQISIGFDPNIVRNDFPILKQKVNGKDLVWFDNAATTQKPNVVIDSISEYYRTINSNIHRGAHTLAALSTEAYESARETIKTFIGAKSMNEIILVRGTTEGINLIANTYGKRFLQPGDEILIPELEHHANIVPWQMIAKEKGAIIKKIPINDRGEINLDAYASLLSSKTKIVTVCKVSNSLGTINPVKQMIDMAHRVGAIAIVDGAQSVAHTITNVLELNCDFFVFSGHKVYGPTGIGAVYGKEELLNIMPPWQGGGNMIKDVTFEETQYNPPPATFEAGTPNIADTVGLSSALRYLMGLGLPAIEQYELQLTQYAMNHMSKIPGLRLIGTAKNKISVLSFVIDGVPNDLIGKALDAEGIEVRVGHHCALPSLRRFGLEKTVRPSIAMYNTKEEIDKMITILKKIVS